MNHRATVEQLIELTQTYRIESLDVTARKFTNGREGVFTFLSLTSLVSPAQQMLHARCSLAKYTGYFSYSDATASKLKEELTDNAESWWLNDAMMVTTAADAYLLTQDTSIVLRY